MATNLIRILSRKDRPI